MDVFIATTKHGDSLSNKTDRHDITEILLNATLSIINKQNEHYDIKVCQSFA
jgi:hypothetical protein